MNTKSRIKNLYNIAPEFHRIPHFNKEISQMTHDDIQLESPVEFPLECFVQEKVDGANLGVSWTTGPIIRNRNNILKKGYIEKETPAKLQFRPTWNWVHQHNKEIQWISKQLHSNILIFGEWMYAKHSLEYDKLPDLFLAYDIWVVEDNKYLSPERVEDLLKQTTICYIKPQKLIINSIDGIIKLSEQNSTYRTGIREGIVVKTSDSKFLKESWKVVNKHFERREDFNTCLIRNKIVSLNRK